MQQRVWVVSDRDNKKHEIEARGARWYQAFLADTGLEELSWPIEVLNCPCDNLLVLPNIAGIDPRDRRQAGNLSFKLHLKGHPKSYVCHDCMQKNKTRAT